MADPFVAEIRMAGFNFAPTGWALCNGQLMPISQNTALFSLLGTTYGGDGRSTFALPNLAGATPLGAGQGSGLSLYDLGQEGGADVTTLVPTQIPAHTHTIFADSGNATTGTPDNGKALAAADVNTYGLPVNLMPMSGGTLGAVGGEPHNNRQPYLGLTFIIALQGVFPPRF
jgi:microcystin-dependent protein